MTNNFQKFVDTGYIPRTVLKTIAEKIKKGGIELTAEEVAIYKDKAIEIEDIIKSLY